MRPTRPRPLRLALAGLALAAGGCNAVTPFGTFKTYESKGPSYMVGRGSQSYPTTEETLEQVREAMDDVGIHSIARRAEDRSTIFEGTTASGRRAVVTARAEGATTQVIARFGTLGDEALSLAFFDRLSNRLAPADGEESPGPDPSGKAAPRRARPRRDENPSGSRFSGRFEDGYRDHSRP